MCVFFSLFLSLPPPFLFTLYNSRGYEIESAGATMMAEFLLLLLMMLLLLLLLPSLLLSLLLLVVLLGASNIGGVCYGGDK